QPAWPIGTRFVSPAACTEALLGPAIGANPPGARGARIRNLGGAPSDSQVLNRPGRGRAIGDAPTEGRIPMPSTDPYVVHVDANAQARPFPHFWEQMFGSGHANLPCETAGGAMRGI